MRASDLASLLGAPFAVGLLAGALLAASGALGPRTPAVPEHTTGARPEVSAALLERLEERARELRIEIGRYQLQPLHELIAEARKPSGYSARNALVTRVAAHDSQVTTTLEALAKTLRDRAARARYELILYEGTQETRWLDELLATADRPDTDDESPDGYWDVLRDCLELRDLDRDARVRVLEFLATRRSDEAGRALPLSECIDCYAIEQFEKPASYYAVIQRARDFVLGDSSSSGTRLGALPAFSGEAYVVTLAKLLASERLGLGERSRVIESHRLWDARLARWNPELAASLPTGMSAPDWQRWIDGHSTLVARWTAPDLAKSRGL